MRSRFLTVGLTAVLAAAVGAGATLALRSEPPRSADVVAVARGGLGSVVALDVHTGGSEGAATGFAVGGGRFLTAAHVVPEDARVWAVLPDGRRVEARVVRRDPTGDVALLSFDGVADIPSLRLASATVPRPGSDVVVLANLLGAGGLPAVSRGIVAAAGRSISGQRPLEDLLQLDVAAGPGSSGAPVLDRDGRVVGMVLAVPDAAPGMAFAVGVARLAAMLAG